MRPAADDLRHPPGGDPAWCEWWSWDGAAPDGTGVAVRVVLHPHARRTWYWTHLVLPGAPPVLVRDHDVPPPRGGGLLLKADAFWAECECGAPWEAWTLGVETYGVALDDPVEAYRTERGERVPVAFDLEWEATTPAVDVGGAGGADRVRVEQAGTLRGEIEVGDRHVRLDGRAHRVHEWGRRDWFTDGGFAAGLAGDAGAIGAAGTAAWAWRAGAGGLETGLAVSGRVAFDAEGLPAGGTLGFGSAPPAPVEVLGVTPVPLRDPAGRTARLPRALVRVGGAEPSPSGLLGWCEWLQPGAPLGPHAGR